MVELVGREPLIIARVENGVTKFSPQRQKTPKFSKRNWIRKTVFSGEFSFYGRGKTNFFGGGRYNIKNGVPVTILGHIQACPTRFLAQKTFVIFKKRWPKKNIFLGRPACTEFDSVRWDGLGQLGVPPQSSLGYFRAIGATTSPMRTYCSR